MDNLNDIFKNFGSTGIDESNTENVADTNVSKSQSLLINVLTIYLVWVYPIVRVALYSFILYYIMLCCYNVYNIPYTTYFISYASFEVIFFGGISRVLKKIKVTKN